MAETSRQQFLRMVGGPGALGALALVLSACGDEKTTAAVTNPSATTGVGVNARSAIGGDIGIVNYALNLEHIESAFYREVVKSGVVKEERARTLLKRIDVNERRHVEVLTKAVSDLGGTPVKVPASLNFDRVIEGGEDKILQTTAKLENVGAAAYLGQAAKIRSDMVLSAALSIHTVEARQAAAVNELVGRGFNSGGDFSGAVPNGAFAKPLSRAQAMRQIRSIFPSLESS